MTALPPAAATAPGSEGSPAAPPCYQADVDEMTAMGLAVLATFRDRLVARTATGSTITIHTVLDQLDGYAAELATRHEDDQDDDGPSREEA